MRLQKNDVQTEKVLLYRGGSRKGFAWLSMFYALLCTLGIYILLPISEWIDVSKGRDFEIRTVDTSKLIVKPPEIRERILPKPAPERREEKRSRVKPKLDIPETRKRIRSKLPVTLEMGAVNFTGDFALNFAMVSKKPELAIETHSEPIIFELDDVDRVPRPLVRHEPVYPYRARRREIEGYVKVRFVVDPEGNAKEIEVVESEPRDIFEKNAKKAVAGWRFEPAMKGGCPVSVRMETNLFFQIKDS